MRSIADIFHSHEVLDAEGRHVNGTDKHGPNHQYGYAYQYLLDYYDVARRDVALMMEVGIADGSSLLAWREVFPNAICVGMDIHPSERARGACIEFNLGDQRSLEDCRRAADGRQFDFICEDATHQLENSLITLLYLWPFVRPGGLYVIEEFSNIGDLRGNVEALWPNVKVFNTVGPSGGIEPLVVFRKPVTTRV